MAWRAIERAPDRSIKRANIFVMVNCGGTRTTNRFNYPADTKTQNGCPAGSASTYNGSTSSSERS